VSPRASVDTLEKRKKSLPLPGIETWCLGWPPCSLVSILTLSWIKLSMFQLP